MDTNIINKVFPLIPNNSLLKYDIEGLWSISLPSDADKISNLIINNFGSDLFILDGTSGIGGNVISFSKHFKKVCGIEINKERFEILKNNINTFQLTNVILINDDCINHLDNKYDLYFFDPPWGGPNYKQKDNIRFNLGIFSLSDIIIKIKNINNKTIIFKLPNNYDLSEFSNYNYNIIKIKNYIILIIK